MKLFVKGPRGFFPGVCDVHDDGVRYKHHIDWPVRSTMQWRQFDNLAELVRHKEWQPMTPQLLQLPAGV